jgi:hypothetical protein
MVDITKCANYWKCPLAKCCKRVLAEDDRYGWQSYADYYVENRTECDYFIPVKNEENNINRSEEVKNV